MEIRWSPEAAAEFTAIIQYIRQDNADAALRVARTIYRTIAQLKTFPNRGRPGRVDGTRELVFPPLPFVVVYRVQASDQRLNRGFHSR
jgi:toxin ParE1/3/4